MDAIERGVRRRPYVPGVKFVAFCDHSHGSNDDATLSIGHKANERFVVDLVVKQGPAPPFNMVQVIPRFVAILREYHVSSVVGDSVGGETYRGEWLKAGIQYRVSKVTTSELYEALEPLLNGHRVVLPDVPDLEQQLLGLAWKGGKITHATNSHDDFATSASGVVSLLTSSGGWGVLPVFSWTTTPADRAEAYRWNPNTW